MTPFEALKPVNKFENRDKAVSRIWEAIQKLAPAAQQGERDAPPEAARKQKTTPKKSALKTRKTGQAAKRKGNRKAAKDVPAREGSKKQIVIDLLSRKSGATLPDIAKATGWQNHSIRGFISGALNRKMGLTIESSKNEAGERTYRLGK